MWYHIKEFFAQIKWRIVSWSEERQYKKHHELAKVTAGAFEITLADGQKVRILPETEHPLHKGRIKEVRAEIGSLPDNYICNLNIGDSLTHLAEGQVKDLFEIFAPLSGSVAFHMQQMMKGISTNIKKKNLFIKNLCIGTVIGNQMLPYENVDESSKDLVATLDMARKLFPEAKIIYYALPPAYNLNVIRHALYIEALAYEWAVTDGNASVVSLRKMGTGIFGLLATTEYSSDGVHLTPRGGMKLKKAFKKAIDKSPLRFIKA